MPRDRDLISLLEAGASDTPYKPLYSFLDRDLNCSESLTYARLFEDARNFACRLQRSGLNRTPVLLIQQKNVEFVRSFWACILAGAWPMPCARPRGHKWSQLAALAVQSGASAIITSSAIARFMPRHQLEGIPVIVSDQQTGSTSPEEAGNSRMPWIRPSITADDIAFIQYTSGSTSNPKGVVITHANVMNNLASISRAFGCTSNDVGLSWLPLHHDMGLIGHVLQPLYAGIHNYFLNPVDFLADPSRWIEAVSKYCVTISGGPGFAFGFCARQTGQLPKSLNLGQWRLAYCGSDRISATTLELFAKRYAESGFSRNAWFPCYGMAESTLYVCGVRGIALSSVTGSRENYVCIGDLKDQRNDEAVVEIVDPVTRQVCAEGVAGEIWISSASVSPGYYRQSILSRYSFNQIAGSRPAFFRTGDLGFIRDGRLYFSGRLKNVIKVRGRSLHAEDIESLLQIETADLGLQRCVALGVQADEIDTFVIMAERKGRRRAVGAADDRQLERQLKNLVCDTFGVIPHAVVIVPSATLPLTSSGKPVRSMCLDVYAELIGAADPAGKRSSGKVASKQAKEVANA
ncbi:MAG: fatty acyl-AMP ligase [Pseudohongiella sp.]|nr:fatty acyl-AMP ligase [Pseudohongiella sp.]